jgi:transposase
MIYIGIDVSKDSLMIACPTTVTPKALFTTLSVANTCKTITEWLNEQPDLQRLHVIFEATGSYSYRLAYCLDLHEVTYSLVTPKQSHHFAETLKIVSQNDERDAILLSLYGQKMTPAPSVLVDETLHHLRQQRHHLSTLITQKQAVDNQLHALAYDPRANEKVKNSLETMQQVLIEQIESFKKDLYDLDEERYGQIYDKLIQIVGIGPAAASGLIIATNGFTNFDNVKQVCKFIGTIPKTKDSGKSVHLNKGIIQTGVPYLRGILYCAAKSAVRFNKACKELYLRLRQNGKPHKVAMVAVINKLLKQAFAVVKKNLDFDNNFAIAK